MSKVALALGCSRMVIDAHVNLGDCLNMGNDALIARNAEAVLFVNLENSALNVKIAEEILFVNMREYALNAKGAEAELFLAYNQHLIQFLSLYHSQQSLVTSHLKSHCSQKMSCTMLQICMTRIPNVQEHGYKVTISIVINNLQMSQHKQ